MSLNKRNLSAVIGCYVIWGILPAYWNLMSGIDSILILCCRVIFSFVFTTGLLILSGRFQALRDILGNKTAMLYLAPASVMITFNWGLYIWAINTGRVLDCSLGYFMNPLFVLLLGVIIFREKCSKLQLIAVAIALVGVLVSVIAYGSFPFVSIGLAVSFSLYGMLMKKAHTDPVAGIAVEGILITPFALFFALAFRGGNVGVLSISDVFLLTGGGVLTALPLILHSRAVSNIPLIIVGFFQYISPSLTLLYGLGTGETPSGSQLVSFIFIGVGLVVFSIALVRISKAESSLNALSRDVLE